MPTPSPIAASTSRPNAHSWLGPALLILCLLPFVPGVFGPFQLDDLPNLGRVRLGSISLDAVYRAVFSNSSGLLRRPLSNVTFLLQGELGGWSPFGFKLFNLLLHGLNGWLVWKLAVRVLALIAPQAPENRRIVALLATSIWIVHPLQVSTVLYVVQRMTLLSTTFMLLAILIALRSLDVPGTLARWTDGAQRTLLVGIVSLGAVACKENGALVPFLLLATFLAMQSTMHSLATDSAGKKFFERVGIWLPCATAIVLMAYEWPHIAGAYAGRSFTLAERLVTECRVLGEYVLSFVVPLPSQLGLYLDDTPLSDLTAPGWFLAPLLAILVLCGALAVRRKYPMLAFAVLWFFACHLLESSVIALELKYEHRNYLALFGPALFLASAVGSLASVVRRRVVLMVSIGVVAMLASMTLARSIDWSDEERFVASELRHHPDSLRAQMEAARLDSVHGRNDLAAARIQALHARNPEKYAPLAGSLELGCAGYPVDWNALGRYMRDHPEDAAIQNQPLYATLVAYIQRQACTPEFQTAFLRHIDAALVLYADNNRGGGLQFFLMVKAMLEPDPAARRIWLKQAIATSPAETGPRIQLAYLDLALGNRYEARATIDELDRLIPRWHPDRMFVRELKQSLQQAEAP